MDTFKTVGYSLKVASPILTPVSDEYNIRVNAPVLQKAEMIIDVNSDVNSIGIIGNNLDNLIKEIEDVFIPKISEIPSFYRNIWFYEIQLKIKINEKVHSTFKNIKKFEIRKTIGIIEGIDDKMNVHGITLWNTDNPDTENFTEVKLSSDIHNPELMIYQIIMRRKQEIDFIESVKKMKQNLSSYPLP